jgi:hypothetical protein
MNNRGLAPLEDVIRLQERILINLHRTITPREVVAARKLVHESIVILKEVLS